MKTKASREAATRLPAFGLHLCSELASGASSVRLAKNSRRDIFREVRRRGLCDQCRACDSRYGLLAAQVAKLATAIFRRAGRHFGGPVALRPRVWLSRP